MIVGGRGNDTMAGRLGDDLLIGGVGADCYVFGVNSGRDLIHGFNLPEGDRIDLRGQGYIVSSSQNGDALLVLSGGGSVELVGIRPHLVNISYFL